MQAWLKKHWQEIIILILLVISLTGLMIRFDRPLIRGDGTAYLAWVDSLVLDQDIDLANQAERLQPVNTYQVVWYDKTERFVTVFPFGVAFLQAPFYMIGDLVGKPNANPDYFRQMQGVGQSYSFWLMIGANVILLATLLIGWRMARQVCDSWTAAFLALALIVGTPLFFYSTVNPLNSHNPGAFVTTLFVLALLKISRPFTPPLPSPYTGRVGRGIGWWLLLGFCGGMMVLVRWQLALVVGCAWLLLIWEQRKNGNWRDLIIATAAAVMTMLPLPICWQILFGNPFVVPNEELYGEKFLLLPPPNTHQVLWNMLLRSPILIFSLAGLPFLWQRNPAWGWFAVGTIGLQLLVNGAVKDWYAGDGFGPRRMSELYPLFVLSAGCLLGQISWKNLRLALPNPPRHNGEGLKEKDFYWRNPQFLREAGRLILRAIVILLIPYAIVYTIAFLTYGWVNQHGKATDSPYQIMHYYLNLPNRDLIVSEVMRTHLGPPSWSEPGP